MKIKINKEKFRIDVRGREREKKEEKKRIQFDKT